MQTAILTGRPLTFLGAVAVVAVWAITGPIFHYSDTWQLVINTGTTIVTFLMVFLIQATQNRDTLALQIKLSELILALEGARNELAAVERQPEGALEHIAEEIRQRAGVPDNPGKTKPPRRARSRGALAAPIGR
jgi:low affinity Fe/Cu permease